jgi:hypothetical protein
MGITTDLYNNIADMFKEEIKPVLWDRYRIAMIRCDSVFSERHFARLLRFMVLRNPGAAEMGGAKYVATFIDQDVIADLTRRGSLMREIIRVTWGGFKHDQVLRIWGMQIPQQTNQEMFEEVYE